MEKLRLIGGSHHGEQREWDPSKSLILPSLKPDSFAIFGDRLDPNIKPVSAYPAEMYIPIKFGFFGKEIWFLVCTSDDLNPRFEVEQWVLSRI